MFMCYPNWARIGCFCGKHGGLETYSYPYLFRLLPLVKNLLLKAVACILLHLDVNTTLLLFVDAVVNREVR